MSDADFATAYELAQLERRSRPSPEVLRLYAGWFAVHQPNAMLDLTSRFASPARLLRLVAEHTEKK